MTAASYDKLMQGLAKGSFSPIYYLMGEEAYFIDRVSDWIADNVLQEEEKDFNQTIVFGADTTMSNVLDYAMRYPMMSQRQVVIVKEAQVLKDTELLENYISRPMPSTVLVSVSYTHLTLPTSLRV